VRVLIQQYEPPAILAARVHANHGPRAQTPHPPLKSHMRNLLSSC
jgi:hypothetical protein